MTEFNLAALNTYLAQSGNGFAEVKQVKKFAGGYSNLTFLLNDDYVLRMPPKGAKAIKGGHDMAREYGILSSLKLSGFHQIPEPILLCKDESVIGDVFYLMKKVDGPILRAENTSELLKTISKNKFSNLSKVLCETQASLHNLDIHGTELLNIGKPNGYVERQVKGWEKRYLASCNQPINAMINVFDYLKKHIPLPQRVSLLHNDFKYDNVVFDESLETVKALLDWEMCTIGDPLMDLGSTLAYWVEIEEPDFLKAFNISWIPGNITRDEYIEHYEAFTGLNLREILFYYAFGLVKNAVIIQQIFSRYEKGLTQDPRFKHLGKGVKILAEKAAESLHKQKLL